MSRLYVRLRVLTEEIENSYLKYSHGDEELSESSLGLDIAEHLSVRELYSESDCENH